MKQESTQYMGSVMSASVIHFLSFFLQLLPLMSWSFVVVFMITFLYRGPVSPYRTTKFKGYMRGH